MPEMQLRELSFISRTDLAEDNILQPLLRRCPRMEKLEMAMMRQVYTLQHLSHALRENKLPRLRYFVIGWLGSNNFQEAFAEVLTHVKCGLDTFEFRSNPSGVVTQSLIQHHSPSLTSLDLECSIISVLTFSDLMAGLQNLRTLKASIRACMPHERYARNIPAPVKHWGCVDLRDLQLYLSAFDSAFSGSKWTESREKLCLDYVFSEVAKLTNLRALTIRGDLKDLYLDQHGYLAQLTDLKRLQVFDLAKISQNEFGKQEALWMVKNWPRLLKVYARDAPTIFKETLLEERPLVEVVNRE